MENNRQVVRLTEEQLNFIVENAVRDAMLQEISGQGIVGAANAALDMGKKFFRGWNQKSANPGNNPSVMDTTPRQMMTNVKNGFGKAKQFAKDGYEAIKSGAQHGEYTALADKTIQSLNNFLTTAQQTPGLAGRETISAVKNAIRQIQGSKGRSGAKVSGNINTANRNFGF